VIYLFDIIIFSNRLKELRKKNKVNQSYIAALLRVTKTQISDLENGKTTTSIERLYILADYFDVSIDYLVGRTDNRDSHKL
jgi:transcriptional regulator with XRE-family HTH domain